MTQGSNKLYFVYDVLGPSAVIHNDGSATTTYYYTRNAQGDITGIVNASGTEVAKYAYDAWGNPIPVPDAPTSTVGELNPLRYRGYVYDGDSGLYYLQSRYYNPSWGRFINADVFVSTGQDFTGENMFAYCSNNPANRYDPTGEISLTLLFVSATINVITSGIAAIATGQKFGIGDAVAAAAIGAINATSTIGKIAAGVISGVRTGVSAHQSGATVGGAILSGTVSALTTTLSIGNLAGFAGCASDLVETAIVDLTFGTGYNVISATVNKVVTGGNQKNDTINAFSRRDRVGNMLDAIRRKIKGYAPVLLAN